MIQRLSIALAHVITGNNSENLWNKIKQIVYSLYQSKEIPKKLYNNIIKSIQINTDLENGYYIYELLLYLFIILTQKTVKLLILMFRYLNLLIK